MLIKILTNDCTTIIISDITNVEIHNVSIFNQNEIPLTYFEIHDLALKYKGKYITPTLSRNVAQSPYIETFDREDDLAYDTQSFVIDYEKDRIWKRMIILNKAYICNDDGKTLAKVG